MLLPQHLFLHANGYLKENRLFSSAIIVGHHCCQVSESGGCQKSTRWCLPPLEGLQSNFFSYISDQKLQRWRSRKPGLSLWTRQRTTDSYFLPQEEQDVVKKRLWPLSFERTQVTDIKINLSGFVFIIVPQTALMYSGECSQTLTPMWMWKASLTHLHGLCPKVFGQEELLHW